MAVDLETSERWGREDNGPDLQELREGVEQEIARLEAEADNAAPVEGDDYHG